MMDEMKDNIKCINMTMERYPATLQKIRELVKKYEDEEDDDNKQEIADEMKDMAFSIQVRSDWHDLGDADLEFNDFNITLTEDITHIYISGKHYIDSFGVYTFYSTLKYDDLYRNEYIISLSDDDRDIIDILSKIVLDL